MNWRSGVLLFCAHKKKYDVECELKFYCQHERRKENPKHHLSKFNMKNNLRAKLYKLKTYLFCKIKSS